MNTPSSTRVGGLGSLTNPLQNPFQGSTQAVNSAKPASEIEQTIEQLDHAIIELSDHVATLASQLRPVCFGPNGQDPDMDCEKRPERPTQLSERIYRNVEALHKISRGVRELQERLGI